jgi:hypothetical protein
MNEAMEALRRRIEHEDNLINQRLSSLVASQAFLLTAFAISLNAPSAPSSSVYAHANRMLVDLLPVVAIACIVVLWLTLVGAIWSMAVLRAQGAAIDRPGDIPIHNRPAIRRLGLAGPVAIPGVFLILWIAVIAAR